MNKIVHYFQRQTTSSRYIPFVDGLRFLAISAVFLQHVQQFIVVNTNAIALNQDIISDLIHGWHFGVELFFVVSGFILALPFARYYLLGEGKVSLKRFYFRRLTRLEPPFILALLLAIFIQIGYLNHEYVELKSHIWSSLFYIHNIVFYHTSIVNPVFWSLEIEIQFYFLAPALAHVFVIKNILTRRLVIVCIGLIAFVTKHLLAATLFIPPVTLLTFLVYFMAGMLLVDIYLIDWNQKPKKHIKYDLFALPCWGIVISLHLYKIPASSIVMATMIFISVYLSFRSVMLTTIFENKYVVIIGGMCYSIYLLHYLAFLVIGSALFPFENLSLGENTLVWSFVLFVVTLPIYCIFYLLIEKPCMNKAWPVHLSSNVKKIFSGRWS